MTSWSADTWFMFLSLRRWTWTQLFFFRDIWSHWFICKFCMSQPPWVDLTGKRFFYDTFSTLLWDLTIWILSVEAIVALIEVERIFTSSYLSKAVLFWHEFKSLRFWRNVSCHWNWRSISSCSTRAIKLFFKTVRRLSWFKWFLERGLTLLICQLINHWFKLWIDVLSGMKWLLEFYWNDWIRFAISKLWSTTWNSLGRRFISDRPWIFLVHFTTNSLLLCWSWRHCCCGKSIAIQ